MNKITIQDLERALHKVDLINRPLAVFVNPSEKDKFEKILKDAGYEDKVLLYENDGVEKGKVIAADRRAVEECIYEPKHPWANNSFG